MVAWGREIWSNPQAAFVWILVRAGEKKTPHPWRAIAMKVLEVEEKLSYCHQWETHSQEETARMLSHYHRLLTSLYKLSCRQDHLNTTKRPEEWDKRSWIWGLQTVSVPCPHTASIIQRKLASPPRADPSFAAHQLAPCLSQLAEVLR